MPGNTAIRRALPLAMLVAAALVVATLVTWIAEKPVQQPRPKVQADLRHATAPPDAGVEPPPVLLHDRTQVRAATRPQEQLAGWAEALSDRLNIPVAALEAYGYAARSVQVSHPKCGLSWSLLAGIGAIESSHGRYGGARLDETGRPTVPIRGLPLDGQHGVKRVPDTDTGRLDGDSQFDRAVGPLQFIPATWTQWGADADGDGIADPNDIDDAALTAATYLCSVGGDLRNPDRYWAALNVYNESRQYGQDVLDRADQYGRTSHHLLKAP